MQLVFSILWPGALLLSNFFRGVLGNAVNRTIDDTLGDSVTHRRPIFLPSTPGVWKDQTCAQCAIRPNQSLAFNGTWTAATYNSNLGNISATFSFEGTAIYIFFILANNQGPGITTLTECNFTLDGTVVGHFIHQPNASTALQYGDNAMVFSKTGLSNTNHTFQISTTGVNHDVFINFDYAMYTFQNLKGSSSAGTLPPSPSPTPSTMSNDSSQSGAKSVSTGTIVGGIVGGIAALSVLVASLFFLYRRRKKSKLISNIEDAPGSSRSHLHPPVSDALNEARSPQFMSVSSYPTSIHSPSQHVPTMVSSEFLGNVTRTSEASHGHSERSRTYNNRDVLSALPSGHIMMAAGMQRSDSVTTDSTISTALPSTANPFDPTLSMTPPSQPSASGTPALYPAPNTKAELQHMRQRELERQMEDIQEEMKALRMEAAERRTSVKSSDGRRTRLLSRTDSAFEEEEDVSKLKEQIRVMNQQMTLLRDQLQSPWAQGLSDDPPPGYTPR